MRAGRGGRAGYGAVDTRLPTSGAGDVVINHCAAIDQHSGVGKGSGIHHSGG
jgi:hypothetical protein